MPEFSLQQYRSVLLESILEGQTTIDVTVKVGVYFQTFGFFVSLETEWQVCLSLVKFDKNEYFMKHSIYGLVK